jgi:hypothetical protein
MGHELHLNGIVTAIQLSRMSVLNTLLDLAKNRSSFEKIIATIECHSISLSFLSMQNKPSHDNHQR